ncbi:MAG: ankyrin repeat domain-containing protein [Bacteroidales bacterium]|nr:ankyrin repeat domain-containing protein [Bacteroidales bacterium]
MKYIKPIILGIFGLFLFFDSPGQDISVAMRHIFMRQYDSAKIVINNGVDVNQRERGSYLVNTACYRGNLNMVQFLLDKGARVDVIADDGATPLVWAGKGDKTGDIVRLLLEKGADVNAENKLGTSAFDNAVRSYCVSKEPPAIRVLEILVSHGADVDNPIPEGEAAGYTNLAAAIIWEKPELSKFLIDHGADVNHVAGDGNTPLMLACREGYLDQVKLLLDAGARKDGLNKDGKTAMQLAIDNEHQEIVDYLSDR